MQQVAAALLTSLGGNEVNAESNERIFSYVGVVAEKKQLDIDVKQLACKSIKEWMDAAMGDGAEGGTARGEEERGGV